MHLLGICGLDIIKTKRCVAQTACIALKDISDMTQYGLVFVWTQKGAEIEWIIEGGCIMYLAMDSVGGFE